LQKVSIANEKIKNHIIIFVINVVTTSDLKLSIKFGIWIEISKS